MKLLFCSQYVKEEWLKNFNFTLTLAEKDAGLKCNLEGFIYETLSKENTVDIAHPRDVASLDLASYDRIIYSPVYEFNCPFINTGHLNMMLALYPYREKIRTILPDPNTFKSIHESYTFNTEIYKRDYWKAINTTFTEDEIKTCKAFAVYIFEQSKKLCDIFYDHTREEIEESFPPIGNTIYIANFSHCYSHKSKEIPFSEKKNKVGFASINFNRKPNKTYLKTFGITEDDIERIGPEKRVEVKKANGLSENELEDVYNTYKFICCPYTGGKRLTWIRSRVLYTIKNGSIPLLVKDDAKYFGTPFILKKKLNEYTDEELVAIHKQQKEHFYSRLMDEETTLKNINIWLK